MVMRISVVVSMDDVQGYFRGDPWRTAVRDGSFIGWSDTAEVELKPVGPKFKLHVESVDDPSDSEDFVTDKPMKELASFLGHDIPGGEHFEKMSSMTPSRASRALLALAAMVERCEVGPRALARKLRTLSVPFTASSRVADQKQDEENFIARLRSDMEAKGWVVKQEEDDRGLPKLTVDISGIYEATVSVEEVTWEFKFQVTGAPDTLRKGRTNDPIAEYRRYYKDPDIADAARNVKSERRQKTLESQEEATNAPRRRAPEDSGEATTGRPAETGRPAA
jgi:hypothetical protein